LGMRRPCDSPRENTHLSWQLMLIVRTFITTLFLIRLHWTAPENSAIFTYPVLRWQGSVISSAWNTGCRSLSGSPMESGRRERNIRRKNRSGMKSARPLMQHWQENQKTSGNSLEFCRKQGTSIKMENSLPCGEKAMPDLPVSALLARAIQLKNFARCLLGMRFIKVNLQRKTAQAHGQYRCIRSRSCRSLLTSVLKCRRAKAQDMRAGRKSLI